MMLPIIVGIGMTASVLITEGIEWLCNWRPSKRRKAELERIQLVGEALRRSGDKVANVLATLEKLREDLKEARREVFGELIN